MIPPRNYAHDIPSMSPQDHYVRCLSKSIDRINHSLAGDMHYCSSVFTLNSLQKGVNAIFVAKIPLVQSNIILAYRNIYHNIHHVKTKITRHAIVALPKN